MEHDPEGHERLQVHKRKRDVKPEVEEAWAPVVRENAGNTAPLEQQDFATPTAMSDESTSVKRGTVAEADDEGLALGASLKASEARSMI